MSIKQKLLTIREHWLHVVALGILSLSVVTLGSLPVGAQQLTTNGETGYLSLCKSSGKTDADCQTALNSNKQSCQAQVTSKTYASVNECLNHRATYDYGQCDDGSKPDIATGKCANGDSSQAPGSQNNNGNKGPGNTSGNTGGTGTTSGGGGGGSTNISADSGECGGAKTAIINCDGKEGEEAIGDLLRQIVTILSVGVGIVAVGGIVWGAVLYSSARDNSSQTQQAIGVIRNTVIGILLYVFMVAIVNWLIPGGVIK